jgi:type IV pilus assembly protein PilE
MDKGFSLIEMLVVIALVAILAGIAYPMYTQHVIKVRRTEGQTALLSLAAHMERYFTENNSYEGATIPHDIQQNFYRLAIKTATAHTYQLSATAIGWQSNDTQCGILILSHLGQKTPQPCW